jgi:hypothetical protein
LFLPIDNFKLLNFLNFNDIGSNTLNESNAFKKIKMFSKTSFYNLFTNVNNYNNKFLNFSFYFDNNNNELESINYGIKRQQNYLINLNNNNHKTFFNNNSIEK